MAAHNGDVVLVSPGVYAESIDFSGKNITVKSVAGPAATVIDGGAKDWTVQIVRGETQNAVLSGFTVQNGGYVNPSYPNSDGGIIVSESSATITGNIVTGNCGIGIESYFSTPLIQNNTITRNGLAWGCGSYGVRFANGKPVLIGNTISGNGACGLSVQSSIGATVTNNIIVNNLGCGIEYYTDWGITTFTQNLIANNQGPGLSLTAGPVMYENTFSHNGADSLTYFSRAIFQDNIFNDLGPMSCDQLLSAAATFQNNDVFSPLGQPFAGACGNPTTTGGNISVDPLFADPSVNNFHLLPGSLVIGAGNAQQPGLPATDLDGNARLAGNRTLDLGVYQYQGTTTVSQTATSLTFPTTAYLSASTLTVTMNNTGGTAWMAAPPVITGDFKQTNDCENMPGVGAGASCKVTITFSPTSRGSRTGSLTIASNAAAPLSVALKGTGIASLVSVSPVTLVFANQAVGTASAAQSTIVTNSGDSPLTFSSITTTGDFSQSNTCASAIAPGGTCTIAVVFQPQTSGTREGLLILTGNALGNAVSVNLTGNGQASFPTINSLSPSSVAATGAAFALTVNGTGFTSNSQVQWNGQPRSTTFAGATKLTASISAADIAAPGNATVTVFTPQPGGGTSVPTTFTISVPVPVLTSISPTSATVGQSTNTLTITGTGFISGSVVQWNGSARSTTYVSAIQLKGALLAGDIASAGSEVVTVWNPGGGVSNPVVFNIASTAFITISGLSPSSVPAGSPGFTLTVSGSGFTPNTLIVLNGGNRLATTFVSDSTLTAPVAASYVAYAGIVQVGLISGGVNLPSVFTTITVTGPQISGLSPSSVQSQGPGFALTVNGSGFVSGATVRWNNQARPTTFISSSQLTAAIPASDIAASGNASVTVVNPDGTASGPSSINVTTNPAPVISSITPSAASVGSADLIVTLAGSGFVSGSQVRWNGMNRATTPGPAGQFNSPTLLFTIPAADLAAPGVGEVVVYNPPSGGGVSAPKYFAITVNLAGNDVIYDAGRGNLWVSMPSSAGEPYGNSIVPVDPSTGKVGTPIFAGSEPGKMALTDDDNFIYVVLGGSASVARVNLAAQKQDLQFYLGSGQFGPDYPTDVAAISGSPHSVVVSRHYIGLQGAEGGVAVFDDGIVRSKTASGAPQLIPTPNPGLFYGFEPYSFAPLTVDATGVTQGQAVTITAKSLRLDNGILYADNGGVFDPGTGKQLGQVTFSFSSGQLLGATPDSSVGLTFYSTTAPSVVAVDQKTLAITGTMSIPAAVFSNPVYNYVQPPVVRWGSDGLAFLAGSQLFILRSPMIKPASITSAGVVNGATFSPGPIAPGQIVSLFGSGLSSTTAAANGIPLPTSLAGVSVTFDGSPAPLIYASPGQINFQVPWELSGKASTNMLVAIPGGTAQAVTVNLTSYAPGIFTLNSPAGQGVVLIANTTILAAPVGTTSTSRPAVRGEAVTIFATGLGPVSNQPASGGASPSGATVAATTATPHVSIGGSPATVLFSGLAPGFVGLYQVNVTVPDDAPPGGAVPVSFTIGNTAANNVTMAVQ